jgi:purine nucleosidase
VLALGGRADIPVWPGSATPLLQATEDASDIHGDGGLGHAVLPEPAADPASVHAIDAILAAAREHDGELVLVATGPLTNIAAALLRDPELPRRLKRFVFMGGGFHDLGNVTPTAEFNIWADPEAARVVFRAFEAPRAAPMVAIALDVTRRTKLYESDIATIGRRCEGAARGPALLRFLEDAGRHYFDLMEKRRGTRDFVMHDPLAFAVAIDPTLVVTKSVAIDVEITGALTRGMTIADWRGQTRRAPNAEVATEVDAPRFMAGFLDAMERLARS